MTRNELALKVARDSNSTKVASKQWTEVVLDCLADAIEKEEVVHIRGLGKFEHVVRPAGVGRNYKTGERVEIPPKMYVKFTPSEKIKDNVALEDVTLARQE